MSTSNPARDPVEKLAEEFAERFRRGERPSLTEYTTQYPHLADQIRDLFPALVAMEQFGSVADPAQEISESGVLVGARIPRQLGEFRILREVGRGGMGVVFEAVQESLGRHVALKVLAFHGIVKPTYLERFSREARAAAQLHHTNIVPVFGIGEHQGIHYYAMQFIQGQGLDVVLKEVKLLRPRTSGASSGSQPAENSERFRELTVSIAHNLVTGHTERSIGENGGPRLDWIAPADSATTDSGKQVATSPTPPDDDSGLARQPEAQYFRSVARLGVQVAEALDYAHKQGILHRDIKPSNLLLDTAGTAWITDFGLVKAEGSDELTSTGDIVGTVRFMAPERFQGKIDPRNDIYGLGITLYEMLTLRPAFEDANRARLIERVAHEDPPRPRKVDPRIPRDLETIVLKAITKEPARRYPSAEAMAEDLWRFLADRPIRARRASSLEKVWRWCRRNPIEAILTGSVAALLLALVIGLSVAVLLRKERNEALVNWERAEAAEQKWHEEHSLATAAGHLAQARADRWSGKVGQRFQSLEHLAAAARHHPSLELRNEAIACLTLTDLRLAKSWDGFTKETSCLAFDPEFKHYARSDSHGNLSIRTVEDDREIVPLRGPGTHAYYLKFSPDGKFLAAIYHQLPLYIWEWGHAKTVLKVGLSGGMDFSPDSRRVVVGDGGFVRLYDLASGKDEKRLAIGQGSYDFAFDPTGQRLAIVCPESNGVRVYDLCANKVAMTFPSQSGQEGPSWSSDGQMLATCSDEHIYLWDAISGKQRQVLSGHESRVTGIAFNHRRNLLASTSWDGTLRLWDPMTGRQLLSKEGGVFTSPPRFTANDRLLAFTTTGTKVELWQVATSSAVCQVMRGPLYERVTEWTDFSPDGRLLASAHADGVRLSNLNDDREAAFLAIGQTRSVFFHPTDDALITSGDRGVYKWPIRVVPGSTDFQIGPPQPVGEPGETWDACLDLNGHKLAVAQRNKDRAVVVDLDEKAGQVHLGDHFSIARIAISPDDRWVATATYWGGVDSTTKIWDAQTGKLVQDLPRRELQGDATVAFSPDSRWLVTGNFQEYRFYEVGSWEPGRFIAKERESFGAMAFSRDGKTMAILRSPHRVQLIDLATGSELAGFDSPDSQHIQHLCFSLDGSRLAAGCTHQAIQVWDLRAIREELAAMGLDWDLPPYLPRDSSDDAKALQIKVDVGDIGKPRDLEYLQPGEQVALMSFLLTLNAFNYQAYLQRGTALIRLRQWSRAIDDLSLALALMPADAKPKVLALTRRAQSYRQLKDFTRRLADLQLAVKLDPDNLQACNTLAWFYITGPESMRNPEEALPLAQKAVDRAANKLEFLNTLGVVFYRLGEYEQAIATLERSLREGYQAAAFDLFFLAMAHARLGDAVKAKEYYDRAVKWIQEHQDQVNNSGQVVGTYLDANNVFHAFLLSGGQYTTLDDPNAGTGAFQGTLAYGINDAGKIVGFYYDANNLVHGFLATPVHANAFGASNDLAPRSSLTNPSGTLNLLVPAAGLSNAAPPGNLIVSAASTSGAGGGDSGGAYSLGKSKTSALEFHTWQSLMNQEAIALPTTVTDQRSIPNISAAAAQPDASLWNDPLAPLILGF